MKEEAQSAGLSITVDRAEAPDPKLLLNGAKDGFEFLQIHYTFKNSSKETIETPKSKAIYLDYEEGETGDASNMASEDGSPVLPDKEKESMYRGYVELAPGESVSGWMLYQRPADQTGITLHYYSGSINKAPDLIFRFSIE